MYKIFSESEQLDKLEKIKPFGHSKDSKKSASLTEEVKSYLDILGKAFDWVFS